MCLIKAELQQQQQQQHQIARTPGRSPWRRLRQNLRPKLNRKVVPGSRINLNHFWADFAKPGQPVLVLAGSPHNDNAINDNLLNERTEQLALAAKPNDP